MKATREDLLQSINNIIMSDYANAKYITEDDRISDSGVDSFGIVVFFLEIECEYGVYGKTELERANLGKIRAKEVIDRIINESN